MVASGWSISGFDSSQAGRNGAPVDLSEYGSMEGLGIQRQVSADLIVRPGFHRWSLPHKVSLDLGIECLGLTLALLGWIGTRGD
jgi:hypothetical protein